jgi:tRNA pseudouridine38-40 synthase
MGWQRQAHGPSVQQAIEEAVAAITGEESVLHAAGRTDAGVHALAMAAHVDIARPISPTGSPRASTPACGPLPVAILAAAAVADDWHARFSCIGRRYLYRIVNRRAPLALEAGRAWQVPVPLDAAAMQDAAQILVGGHDFTTFRSAHCQSDSPVKTLDRLDVGAGEGDDRDRGGGALLPPPPGALDGRLPAAGRAREMERGGLRRRWRRATGRALGSTRRRTGCISSRRSIPRRHPELVSGSSPPPLGRRPAGPETSSG